MERLSFLDFTLELSSPAVVSAYDELPLWSAMFGQLLLEEVPLAGVRRALDVGCGTGFPAIELAERLGPDVGVSAVDIWKAGLDRAREKVATRGTPNLTIHEAGASSMPFGNASFDLVVSNLGVNNFDDREGAIRECRRVSRPSATIALTTNLQGHMRELYDAFAEVLADDGERTARLREHVAHRATVDGTRELLETNGFSVRRIVERQSVMRFASASALFNHYFIKLGFLDAWKQVAQGRDREIFEALLGRLGAGEIRLTIPMAYIEGVAR